MPASALLKFTQGATVGGDGRALVGVLTTSVALSNVNNTGVQSWQIDLVYVDPTSSLTITTAYAFNDASSTPAANFVPDVRCSYRWVLKVWDVPGRDGDPSGVDIRVFSVRELNGALIPPSQVWPQPLPDPRSGELNAKPNEMNFDGQLDGWHGTGLDGQLNQLLAKHLPPLPGSLGDVLTVVAGRWASAPPSGAGAGDVNGPGSSVDGNIVIWSGISGTEIADSGVNLSAFIRHDGSVPFTASQSLGGFRVTSLANGTAASDAVNKGQLDAAIAGLDPKGNVRALATTNVAALTGLGALGGVGSFTDGQRVGLIGQSTPSQNGIWVVHVGAWTRPTDFDTGMDVSGAYFMVEEGTSADRGFICTSDTGSAVVGTNNLVFQDFGTSSVTAGDGLQKVGSTISVLHDGGTLSSSGSGLKVAPAGITTTEIGAGAVSLTTQVTGLLPFANIANGAATSVLGRGPNSIGVMASIAASADGQVLRRAAGALSFGAVDLADGDAVTGLLPFSNLANIVGLSVLGRSVNTAGVGAAITGTDGQVLRVSGTTLGFGTLATAALADDSVTMGKLADLAGLSVIGRSANTLGTPAAITASATGQVLRYAGTTIAFGPLDLADADAVTGLLPGTNVNPNFGTGAVIVGGRLDLGATPATSGDIRLTALSSIQFRNVGGSANLLALSMGSSDEIRIGNTGAIGYQQSATNHDFRMAGATVVSMEVDRVNLGTGVSRIQFAAAAVSPLITHVADTGAGITADQFSIVAQDATGTGSTTGGVLHARAGNSTNGVGGGLDIRSGAGATQTQAGIFNLRVGSTVFFSYPGDQVPATSGMLRVPHNTAVIVGRNNDNSANENLVRWGTTTDELIIGNTGFITRVFGNDVYVGNAADTWLRVDGTTNRLTMGHGGTGTLSFGASLIEFGAAPAAGGNLRWSHNMSLRGRDNAGANDRNGVRWGATTDTWQFGDATVGTQLFGSVASYVAFGAAPATDGTIRWDHNGITGMTLQGRLLDNSDNTVGVKWGVGDAGLATDTWQFGSILARTEVLGSSVVVDGNEVRIGDAITMIEAATLATNREVIALFHGSALTTTQMPADTGDRVLYWADATTAPTTGVPAGGLIAWADATQGLSVKGKNNAETTLAPHGLSGSGLTGRQFQGVKVSGAASTSATTTITLVNIDCTSFLGSAIGAKTLLVRVRGVVFSNGGSYGTAYERVSAFLVGASSTPSQIGTTVSGNGDADGIIGTDVSAVTFDANGNNIRLRVTPATGDTFNHYATVEVFGA